jgi:hypothetical protein
MNEHREALDRRIRAAVSLYLKSEITAVELSATIDSIISEAGAARRRGERAEWLDVPRSRWRALR